MTSRSVQRPLVAQYPEPIYVPLHRERLVPLVPFDDAVQTPQELRQRWPGCAIGVRADRAELLVVDVDVKHGAPGPETMRRLQDELGDLPPTRTHRTRSGGWHLLFRGVDGVRSAQGHLRGRGIEAPGVDVVAGRAVIRWVPGTPGYTLAREGPFAELPPAWADAVRDPAEEPRTAPSIPEGDSPARRYAIAALEQEGVELARATSLRNCTLNKAAGSLGQLIPAITEDEIRAVLLAACEQNGALREHGRRACEGTITRGIRWGREHPRTA